MLGKRSSQTLRVSDSAEVDSKRPASCPIPTLDEQKRKSKKHEFERTIPSGPTSPTKIAQKVQNASALFDPNLASPPNEFMQNLALRMNIYFEPDVRCV